MDFLVLVILALCIWGCIAQAQKNGRNAVLAGILGFLFGIFAVIGYALAGSARKCTQCRGSVDMQATVCRHCKSTL